MTLQPITLFSLALALAGGLSGQAGGRSAPVASTAGTANDRHSVLLISIDGLIPDAVLAADSHALKIPVLRNLLSQGSYAREVVNVNPTVTNPNHTTLVTGVLPSEHGIYNNRPFEASATLPKSYSQYAQIKAPTLWGAAKAAGLTTGSIFWPVTDQAADIDFNLKQGSDEDDQKIADDAIALIDRERPELLTIHFVSLDHEEHETGPWSAEANAVLERIDAAIGRIIAAERRTYPDSVVAIVSDHGFFRVTDQVNLNTALVDAGFITLGRGGDLSIASWKAFAWYVGGSAMIMLRDPQDRDTASRVGIFLKALAANPEAGIEHIYARNEVADAGLAPDAVFIVAFKPGYRMGNALTGPLRVASAGGAHGAYSTTTVRPDMHSSFFIAGPGIARGRNLGAIDIRQIAPTLAENLKVSLPSGRKPPLSLNGK